MSKITGFLILIFLAVGARAQKSKVQAAWRALTDYEGTVTEGKPELNYLNKAKDAIDLALQNEDTKNKGKTHAYKARISYAQYQYDLSQEIKRLETSVTDKNERALVAYGNTNLKDFEDAAQEIIKIKDLDAKYMENIQEGLKKGTSALDDDDMKFAVVAQQIKMESGNIASGKYKAKKFDESADYFYKSAFINSVLYGVKDTLDFYNACISAAKAKNNDKILDYNKKMIDAKIGIAYNYDAIYTAQLAKGDSTAAIETLKKGRAAFPGDMSLTNKETEYFLATGKQEQALASINASIEKDPKSAVLHLIAGQIYDAMANPKDKNTLRDLPKPVNFEELFKKAEASYLKGLELKPTNKDYLYYLTFNLGALYNNYGGTIEDRKPAKITEMAKMQKENEAISMAYYKKAIPYLEQALVMRSNDDLTMKALRKLYLKTGDEAKAKEMNEKLKGVK